MNFKFLILSLFLTLSVKHSKAQTSKSSTVRSSTWSKTSTAISTNSATSPSPTITMYKTSFSIQSTGSTTQTKESTAQPSKTLTDSSSSSAYFFSTSSTISSPQTTSHTASFETSSVKATSLSFTDTTRTSFSSSRTSPGPTKSKSSTTLSTSKPPSTKLNALTTRPRGIVSKKPTQKLANTKLNINNLIKIRFENSSQANSSDILGEIDKTMIYILQNTYPNAVVSSSWSIMDGTLTMNASLQITEPVSASDQVYVFNQEEALSLINNNIQSNMGYLQAVVPSNAVINLDSSKNDITATTVFDSASGARHEVIKADLIGIFLAVFVFNYLLEI